MKPCESTCQKCGSADVCRYHRRKGSERRLGEYGTTANKYEWASGYVGRAIREHINHHCRCCGYEWQTPPLPKAKAVKEGKA